MNRKLNIHLNAGQVAKELVQQMAATDQAYRKLWAPVPDGIGLSLGVELHALDGDMRKVANLAAPALW
eukprot:scaffold484286_cov24-Prasinocladus_malaysianus.AAC.1